VSASLASCRFCTLCTFIVVVDMQLRQMPPYSFTSNQGSHTRCNCHTQYSSSQR